MSRRQIAILGLVLLLCACPAFCGEAPVREIGSRLEPFADTWLIEKLTDTRHVLHHPVPRETVLRFDKPWEGLFCGYVTVIKDGAVYRAYYRGSPKAGKDGSTSEVTCYAESRDGITWTKPSLGLFEVFGTRENNVILANAAPLSHNFSPFLDARPGVPKDERYKALAGTKRSGLVAFASADGIRWRKLFDTPVITAGAFDSQNVSFWSQHEQCYVCYLRTWTRGFRTVSRATSKDFKTWAAPEPMQFGDTPLEHLYTSQTHPYYRAPHLYVATAARFMPGRRVLTPEQAQERGVHAGYFNDCSDSVLLTSRGALQYDRTFMESFIRPGTGLDNWVSRANYPALGIVPAGEREMSVYVQRDYAQPTASLRRFSLRTDGFASIQAPWSGGEMLTRLLVFTGKKLELNVSTSAAGGVRVEIQDASGKPVPGYAAKDCVEIIGDEIARVVTWKGKGEDVSALAGKPVRLRFVMKDADLYAIRMR